MRTIYGFNDQNDFQASKQAGQWYRSISRGVDSEDVIFNENKTFVKIGELISGSDDKEAKGTEVVYDVSARDWIDDPNGYIFDSDGVGNLYTTNIFSHLAMEVDEIVEVIQVPNSDDDDVVNIARKSSAGSSSVCLLIKSVASSVYTCDIVASPSDTVTIIEADVKAKVNTNLTISNENALINDTVISSFSFTENLGLGDETVYYFQAPILF